MAHGSNDGYVVDGAAAEYGGPGSWIFELFIVGCHDPFELGQWAERVAAVPRAHGAPRGDTVMVASFGRQWGVKVYPDS